MNENVFSLGVLLWQVLNLLLTAAIFVFLGWRVWQVLRRRKRMTRVAADSLAERIRVHRQR